MPYQDTQKRYGVISRLIHWTMALLTIAQFMALGGYINDGDHWVGNTIVPWHVDIGLLLLILVSLRIIWMLSQQQRPVPQDQGVNALLAKGGHLLLYLCMVLMPVTGVLLMLGGGHGLGAFGIELVAESEQEIAWAVALGEWHTQISWLFVALVLGHLGAALYHHFVKHDDTLVRMTTKRLGDS